MMGRLETDQGQFFHSDRLGELAPADHPARELDAVLDLSWLRAELAPYYSHNRANRIDENRACVAMVERVARRFALKPRRLAAGAAYGNARTLKSLAAHGIEPHIPVIDKSARPDRLFSRADFKYEQERDPYICPGGKGLRTSGTAHEGTTYKDMAKRSECGTCPLKPECTKGRERRLGRDIDEPIRDQVRALAKTSAFKRSRDERKKVEMACAHMKRIFKLDHFRLRGLNGARDEILLTVGKQPDIDAPHLAISGDMGDNTGEDFP